MRLPAMMPAMRATLWLTTERAVGRKRLRLLSTAVATLPTARTSGWASIMRVRVTVRRLVAASKPGASRVSTKKGVNRPTTTMTAAMKASSAVSTRPTSRPAAASPSFCRALNSTGIMALDSAPPATRLNSVSGRRKAA